MSELCDVNLLLALITDRHAHHRAAAQWVGGVNSGGAVVCRTAQIGLLRLLNNPAVMKEEALSTDDCWTCWHRLVSDERVRFVTAEPAGLDHHFARFTHGRAFAPRLWSDAYLAAYACAGGHRLTTFDQGFRRFEALDCTLLSSHA